MKKLTLTTLFVVTFFALSAVSASAIVNDTLKVGLRYGSSALFSANLENAVGEGYEFGFFDDDCSFESVGWTEETAISMTAAGDIYMSSNGTYSGEMPDGGYDEVLGAWHVEVDGFRSFEDAQDAAQLPVCFCGVLSVGQQRKAGQWYAQLAAQQRHGFQLRCQTCGLQTIQLAVGKAGHRRAPAYAADIQPQIKAVALLRCGERFRL